MAAYMHVIFFWLGYFTVTADVLTNTFLFTGEDITSVILYYVIACRET